MKRLVVLFTIISIGITNSLYARVVKESPKHPFYIFVKKKEGVIKARGQNARGKPPKIRSGYSINRK